jgi:DNA primase catalytic subunit
VCSELTEHVDALQARFRVDPKYLTLNFTASRGYHLAVDEDWFNTLNDREQGQYNKFTYVHVIIKLCPNI